jgi:hypothetical protein
MVTTLSARVDRAGGCGPAGPPWPFRTARRCGRRDHWTVAWANFSPCTVFFNFEINFQFKDSKIHRK